MPAMIRWPGRAQVGAIESGIISGLDQFPAFVAAAGNPNIEEELLKGKQMGDQTYNNHLDSYIHLDMITGMGRRLATNSTTSRKARSPHVAD